MENPIFPYWHKAFLSTGECRKLRTFTQAVWKKFLSAFFHRISFHIPQALWRKLQTGVDICGDVANIVLQVGIAALKCHFHFADGVEDGGVILAKFLADVR